MQQLRADFSREDRRGLIVVELGSTPVRVGDVVELIDAAGNRCQGTVKDIEIGSRLAGCVALREETWTPAYTISPEVRRSLPAFVRRGWGLTITGKVQRFTEGSVNENLRVSTDQGPIVVRRYATKAQTEVLAELECLMCLRFHGALVVEPLARIDDRPIDTLASRPAVAFHYVDGEHPRVSQVADVQRIGQWMAQFHEASGHCTTDGARYSEITEFERAVSQRQALSADGNESFGDELDWLGKRIVPTVVALSEAVPHGLIHADFVPHNLLVVDGMLVAILDLDEAYAASLVRDLADFMRYFPLRPQTIEEDVVTLEALVEGYEQVRHLTSMERRLLPYSWLLSLFSGAVRRLTRRVAQGRSPRWEDAASRGYGPVKDYLISQGLVDTAAG